MKRYVYHDSDYDGFTCAAILKKKYPDIETYALNHESREEPPAVEGYDEVYMCDFSYSQAFMDTLKNNNKQFYWIDHHESASEKLPQYDGLQRFDAAACMLTWEFCFPDEEAPMSVQHVNDYDIWKNELPHTKEFITYLSAIWEERVEPLLHFLDETPEQYNTYYEQGAVVGKSIQNEITYLMQRGHATMYQGYKARVYFYGGMHRSLLAQQVLKNFPDIDMFVSISIQEKNGSVQYKYSFRSRKGEAKVLAEKFGGGGHPNAAATVMDTLVLE